MRNRKALVAPPIDDDPTVRDMITPDMRRTVKAAATGSITVGAAVGADTVTAVACAPIHQPSATAVGRITPAAI